MAGSGGRVGRRTMASREIRGPLFVRVAFGVSRLSRFRHGVGRCESSSVRGGPWGVRVPRFPRGVGTVLHSVRHGAYSWCISAPLKFCEGCVESGEYLEVVRWACADDLAESLYLFFERLTWRGGAYRPLVSRSLWRRGVGHGRRDDGVDTGRCASRDFATCCALGAIVARCLRLVTHPVRRLRCEMPSRCVGRGRWWQPQLCAPLPVLTSGLAARRWCVTVLACFVPGCLGDARARVRGCLATAMPRQLFWRPVLQVEPCRNDIVRVGVGHGGGVVLLFPGDLVEEALT